MMSIPNVRIISPSACANPARRLDQRNWCALALIAALIVCDQVLLQPALARLIFDAPVINVAGRQRMLSQQLTKAALAMTEIDRPDARPQCREELAVAVEAWRRAHRGLQVGDAELRLPGRNRSEVQRAFRELEPHFQAMAIAADELLAGPAIDDPTAPQVRASLATILAHEPEFLTRMHAIVGLYEAEARSRIFRIQQMGLSIMVAILCIQVAVQLGVVRPAVQLFGREFAQSEAQYQQLVESMSDGLVMYDELGRVRFANQRFRSMLGYSQANLRGKPASVFIADADRRRYDALVLEAGRWNGPVELAFQHADGRCIETIVSPQQLFELDGTPKGLLLVLTDITARKAVEQRNRELLDQLAHADRLKSMGEMATGLAHEINQPLGAIANYAEACLARLAEPGTDPGVLEPPLRGILRAALRGGHIIRRARSFARLRPHRVSPESVNDLVREVEQLCLPEARQRGISLESHLATELPLIRVDGIQIQQVLTNLIQNAFAALEGVEPYRRRIKLLTSCGPDDLVELAVSDTGPGVPDDQIERIFEPFVTTRAEGTGLGLAIARSIAETHGGRIWVERNREGGALFRVSIPTELPTIDTEPAAPIDREAVHA